MGFNSLDWRKAEVKLPPDACDACGGEGQQHGLCAPTETNPDGVYDETCPKCGGSGSASKKENE